MLGGNCRPSGFYDALIERLKVAVSIGAKGLPPAALYIWGWFMELDRQRAGNGYGPLPLGFKEIAAWSRLRRVELDQWELSALLTMDSARMESLSHATGDASSLAGPMTPQVFDEVFG